MTFVAWKNLLSERTRFIVSVLGISLAILLLFAIKGIAIGVANSAAKYGNNQDTDIFVLQKGVRNMQMTTSFFPSAVLNEVKAIDGVLEAEGIYGFNYQHEKGELKIASYLVGYEKMGGPWKIKEGKQTPGEDEAVVDFAFAQKAGLKVGDSLEIMEHDFKVAGISRETNPMGGLFIFVNKKTLDKVLQSDSSLNMILIKAKPGTDIDQLVKTIEQKSPLVSAVTASTLAKNDAQMVGDLFGPVINAIVIIVLLVSTVFIGLTIYNATLEKIGEYTILKAIGANKVQLFIVVFFQSAAIALLGTLVGFGLFYLLTYLVYLFMPDITMEASLSLGLKYLWIVPVMALVATYIPLRKIYKIDEADVLRS